MADVWKKGVADDLTDGRQGNPKSDEASRVFEKLKTYSDTLFCRGFPVASTEVLSCGVDPGGDPFLSIYFSNGDVFKIGKSAWRKIKLLDDAIARFDSKRGQIVNSSEDVAIAKQELDRCSELLESKQAEFIGSKSSPVSISQFSTNQY